MKIVLCGSMSFAQDIVKIRGKLKRMGHEVIAPDSVDKYARGYIDTEDKWDKIENDVIKSYFSKISEGEAVLIVNQEKLNIPNYMGGNSLIELAYAHILGKKKFLLNPIPKLNYTDEIEAMHPVILDGDLTKIK